MNTILSPSQLDGRTVLITGGTSGIGLAASIQAKAAGAAVIIVGSNRERTARIAAEHGFAGWRAADVSQPEEIQAAFADVPHIDHLVYSPAALSSARCWKRISHIYDARSTRGFGRPSIFCRRLVTVWRRTLR